MGRKSVNLDQKLIQKIVTELESKQDYKNRSALYSDVVIELVKNHGLETFSASVLNQRINSWTDFVIKTPKGVKGGHLQSGTDALKEWRESGRETKKKVVGDAKPLITHFTTERQGKYLKLAKSIKRGSLKAAVKLKCLDCANFQKEEIKHCQCFDCPLFPVRPFQN